MIINNLIFLFCSIHKADSSFYFKTKFIFIITYPQIIFINEISNEIKNNQNNCN